VRPSEEVVMRRAVVRFVGAVALALCVPLGAGLGVTAGATTTPFAEPFIAAVSPADDGAGLLVWLLPVGVVLIVVGGYVIYTARAGTKQARTALRGCEGEEGTWRVAVRRYDEACRDLQRARGQLAESRQKLADAGRHLAELEGARASEPGPGGAGYHDLPEGGTVTPEGLEALIRTARSVVESFDGDVRLNEESVAGWETQLSEATASEAGARAAFEGCIGAAVTLPAPCPGDETTAQADDVPQRSGGTPTRST
jgi:hypothetical protein